MSNIKTIFLIPLLAILLGLTLFQAVQTQASQPFSPKSDWQSKVDQELLTQLENRGQQEPIEFIVRLDNQADINLDSDLSKTERAAEAYELLKAHAAASQKDLLQQIANAGGIAKPYTIINAIHVTGNGSLLIDLAQQADVAHLHANPAIKLDVQTQANFPFDQVRAPLTVEWGVEKIGAPLVWSKGITGTGAVIAGQDTGYNWEHPALQAKYRGWSNGTADHNYNWHDAISGDISGNSFNPCGYTLTIPCDDVSSQHGTHTMGTMIGADGTNEIGVAPGAEWIACRNMEEGYGTPDTYISCFEWFLAPTNINGQSPDPSKAPDVINNSWGCPPSEGCNTGNFDLMNTVIENLRSAGIVVVTSAGNSGSSCGSVNTPAAIFAGSFSVGATDSGDGIAGFSSRGPVTVDGSQRIKPNVTAPGVSVRSAGSGSSYRSLSGTSMAGPHVAGAVGLAISAYPPIAGNVEAIESYFEETADYVGTGSCGGTDEFNNTYGHGRINVDSAVSAIWNIDIEKSAPETITIPNMGAAPVAGTLTYSIVLTKTGDYLTFTNAILTDTIPAGTVFVSASEAVTESGGTLVWEIGDLPANASQQIDVTIQVMGEAGSSESLTLPAAEISAEHVPAQASNTSNTSINFEEDGGMQFMISRDIPSSFSDPRVSYLSDSSLAISYTISVSAPISIPQTTNVNITETLPAGATVITTSLPVTAGNGYFVWNYPSLNQAETVTLDVTIQVPISPTVSNPISSITFPETEVDSDQTDPRESPSIILIPYNIWMPTMLKSP